MPPNPIIESISPVLPNDLFPIFPGIDFRAMDDRSAGNRLIIGAIIAVVLIKSRLFIAVKSKLNINHKFKRQGFIHKFQKFITGFV
jgi:hypothetical protein